jgi:hypothetical protein
MKGFGRHVEAFEDFSNTAKALLTDPRWPAAFKVSDEDRKRYGNTGPWPGVRPGPQCIAGGRRNSLLFTSASTGWDHHRYIWDRTKDDNHYKLMSDFRSGDSSLIEDLAVTPSKATPGKMLLDETLVVFMSEFGRTPGPLNHMAGRDHHKFAFPAMFAGAGVKGGLVLGASDKDGDKVTDTGWNTESSRASKRRRNHVLRAWHRLVEVDSQYAFGPDLHLRGSFGANGFIPTDELSGIYVSFRRFVLGLLGVALGIPAEPGMVFIPAASTPARRAHEHSDTNPAVLSEPAAR